MRGEDVVEVARLVKDGMETAIRLDVPTPVNIKVTDIFRSSWGGGQDRSKHRTVQNFELFLEIILTD